ncbi:hypothetical protein [Flagellimonas lutaonensis]|uniref:DUF3278 domain-containing protein n=1 Tax=Flagellimonas lutaonensis TaxID=516051 RepID=A0A0D5YT25_9FLAO|nr:hypothetical protein [Allomuricauda lutaonensis]AKA35029.1 hypothetical protein VC82_1405 [Allomuricauda lutaonensis]
MNDFEQLKNNWKEQPIQKPLEANFDRLKNGIVKVAKKQRMTNIILLGAVAILLLFFFYIGAMQYNDVALALGTMIGALVVRVLVEFFSQAYLKNLSTTASMQNFKRKLAGYYKNRIWVHAVLTPILLAIYSYAFWTLLPDFKMSLSKGFYNYIVWSSIVLLIFFSFFIYSHIRKEVKVLKELKDE